MKKSILIFSCLILLVLSANTQERIQIDVENNSTQNQLQISNFYFVHQLFADAFFMTDLYKQLNHDEMLKILKKVQNGVYDNGKVTVTIAQENSPAAKLVFFTKNHPEKGNSLIMMTNFNSSKRTFEKELDDKESIVRWYFIKEEKLVYRKDLYSKSEEKTKKGGDEHELIDYYLFDDNKENDSKVKGLIDDLIESNESKIEQFYGRLYLGEYWLFKGNIKEAEKAVEELKRYFALETEIPRGYSLIVKMATTELELMKKM